MFKYFSFSQLTAGFIAVLIGFTSSAVIVFQAATRAGASPPEISSWLFALGMSIALTCIGLSLYYRMPILTGWSTPGAALLVTGLSGLTMPEAVGVFMFASFLVVVCGVTGLFEKIIDYIPRSLGAAMLAGILLHFGLNVFSAMQDQVALVSTMLMTYLVGKRFFPRYVILLVLMVGIVSALLQGLFHMKDLHFVWSMPILTKPEFSWSALMSVGIPLFIVTMTSQNIPGITVIRNAGYQPNVSSLVTWTGVATFLFAPFGCYSISLAAITAAVCTGKEADANPALRYKATLFAGFCWLLIGLSGAAVVAVFFAFPNELVVGIAGIALLSTIGSSLKVALEEEAEREPAMITILISASGLSLFGVGAAFWGLLVGVIASVVLNGQQAMGVRARTIV